MDDVIKNGEGDRGDIMLLCTALLRSANLDAHPAWACGRDDTYFRREILLNQFDEPLVAVKDAGGWSYLDPSTPYCNYGQVAWYKQDTDVIVLSPESAEILLAPPGKAEQNRVVRTLEGTFEGRAFKGKLRLDYFGNPDFMTRNYWDDETEEERRTFVKEYLEKDFEKVELTAYAFLNLRDPQAPLSITAEFTVPDCLAETRTRYLLKPSLLGKNQTDYFKTDTRRFPVCMSYPYLVEDTLSFTLPTGVTSDQLPNPVNFDNPVGSYSLKTSMEGETLKLQRQFRCKGAFYEATHYGLVKGFYQAARKGDETTVVLKRPE